MSAPNAKQSLKASVAVKRLQIAWDNVFDELYEHWREENTQFPKFMNDNEAVQPVKEFLISRLYLLSEHEIRDELVRKGCYVDQSKQQH